MNDLGLRSITANADYGIRPDDALFPTDSQTSSAPDLLLFEHRASLVNFDLASQTIVFEYDLPRDASVTIELLPATGTTRRTVINNQARKAGWQREVFTAGSDIGAYPRYQIRATMGTYKGQYTQALKPLVRRIYLPFVRGGGVPGGATNYLQNGEFTSARGDKLPDYWHTQAILRSGERPVSDFVRIVNSTIDPRMALSARPGAREEVFQRAALGSTPGCYELAYDLGRSGGPVASQLLVRYRTISGDWSGIVGYGAGGDGSLSRYSHRLYLTSSSVVISFLARFTDSDVTSAFMLDNVSLRFVGFQC